MLKHPHLLGAQQRAAQGGSVRSLWIVSVGSCVSAAAATSSSVTSLCGLVPDASFGLIRLIVWTDPRLCVWTDHSALPCPRKEVEELNHNDWNTLQPTQ
mmetsp:Transcript_6664/g.11659  ORF Transcript_6664/g.11659 Transcript_6664/m.11659 type:complete len:99 (+) Transcript_6664:26-322(+)